MADYYYYYSSIIRNALPWFAAATLGLLLSTVKCSGFCLITIFLTSSTVLILLPVVVSRSTSTKKEEEEELTVEVTEVTEITEKSLSVSSETVSSNSYLLSSSDAMSDSEEYSENEWIFRENKSDSSTTFSDGSISDEESLIEIALPNRHYLDSKTNHNTNNHNNNEQEKWSLESHFRQQTWMEMLSEMNEDNFIEIDLCMGSIKCSRFEIEA